MAVKISRKVWIGGGVAGVAVLAVGVGWALAGPGAGAQASPEVKVTVTAESTDVAPIVATAGAEAAADPIEVVVDPDGIADDEYPEAAPTRTDPNAALEYGNEISYPDALVMEDWVWDRVDEGWSVQVVSVPEFPGPEDWVQPAAVLYLISPEDVYFEVAELPERMWIEARVVSWVEDQEYVRVAWGYFGGSAARIDMRTGAAEDIVFSSYGANATRTLFLSADADGNELWSATSENGTKLYRWDATSQTWAAASLVKEHPDASALWGAWWVESVNSADGRFLLLRELEEDEDGDEVAFRTFVLYDLGSDAFTEVAVPEVEELTVYGADAELVNGGIELFLSWDPEPVAIRYDIESGTWSEFSYSYDDGEEDDWWDGRVVWGEPTSQDADVWVCSC